MLIEMLRDALDKRCLLGFTYKDKPRLVEPHALGLNKKGELVLRGYQVGEEEGWRLFILENATDLGVIIVDLQSQAPRPGYATGDKQMVEILAELPAPEVKEAA